MKKLEAWNYQKIVAIGVAVLIVLGLSLYVTASMPEEFVFEEHLDETVIVVENKNESGETEPDVENNRLTIPLQQLSYYVMLSEENVNRLAEAYNSENTNQFWNIFTNHTFIRTKAKTVAYDACVRDAVYSLEAKKAGIELSTEELKAVEMQAEDLCDGLSYKQATVTKLTPETLEPVLERVTLARKYAKHLLETEDFTESDHMAEVEIEIGGDYYESVKTGYTIETAEFWEKVNLGKITVTQVEK